MPDPYRPLENDTAAATAAWVEAENAVTRAYLTTKYPSATTFTSALPHCSITISMDSHGRKTDGITFYENDGLRNQAVLYRTRSLDQGP